MIDIRFSNGDSLDLRPGTQISFELVSPLFSEQVGYGSQSFQFVVDFSAKNLRNLNRRHLYTKPGNTYAEPVRLYIGGQFWTTASLRLATVNDDSFSLYLDVAESAFAKALADRSLTEWEYGGDRVISAVDGPTDTAAMVTHANSLVNSDGLVSDYCFPVIRWPNFYDPTNSFISLTDPLYLNYYRLGTYYGIGTGYLAGLTWLQSFSPQFFLVNLMAYHVQESGFTFGSDGISNDTAFRAIALMNNYTLDAELTDFIDGGFVVAYGHWSSGTITPSKHVPREVNTLDLWSSFMKTFNCATVIKNGTVSVYPKILALAEGTVHDWTTLSLARPSWKQTDVAVKKKLAWTFDSSDARCDQPPRTKALTTSVDYEVVDVASLPGSAALGEKAFVTETFRLYNWNGQAWDDIGYYVPDSYRIQDSGSELVSLFSPIIEEKTGWERGSLSAPTGDYWQVPYLDQPGNSDIYSMVDNPMGLRIFSFQGTAGGTFDYPKATSLPGYGVGGGEMYSLQWHGEQGIYALFHQQWEEALAGNGKQISILMNLHLRDVSGIDWMDRYRIRVPDGEVRGLLKRIAFTISEQGLSPVNVELITI